MLKQAIISILLINLAAYSTIADCLLPEVNKCITNELKIQTLQVEFHATITAKGKERLTELYNIDCVDSKILFSVAKKKNMLLLSYESKKILFADNYIYVDNLAWCADLYHNNDTLIIPYIWPVYVFRSYLFYFTYFEQDIDWITDYYAKRLTKDNSRIIFKPVLESCFDHELLFSDTYCLLSARYLYPDKASSFLGDSISFLDIVVNCEWEDYVTVNEITIPSRFTIFDIYKDEPLIECILLPNSLKVNHTITDDVFSVPSEIQMVSACENKRIGTFLVSTLEGVFNWIKGNSNSGM